MQLQQQCPLTYNISKDESQEEKSIMTREATPEDEVWNREVAYWGYLRAGEWDLWQDLWHEEVVAWPDNEPGPMYKEGVYQLMSGIAEAADFQNVELEIRRRSVQVYGDIGIVYYEVHTAIPDEAGGFRPVQQRLTHTWLRTEDGWQIIGGMSAPLSSE